MVSGQHSRPPALIVPVRQEGFRGDVKAVANPVFNVVSQDGAAIITIFAEIGGPAGVTAQNIDASLRQFGSQPVIVKINSPGGDVFDGIAIYNLLRAHPQPVTAQVLGIAASAASIITMAADRIEMARNSELMIHQAWMLAVGNGELLRKAADILDKMDAAIAGTYAARSGQPIAEVIAMMADETFLDAGEAIDMGFADALLEADAQPTPTIQDAAPQSRRGFEARLRDLGYSKAAAAKITAGGWPALGGSPDTAEVQQFVERINNATCELKKERIQ